jgi:CRISPR-associated endonuclease/helicase Cas3
MSNKLSGLYAHTPGPTGEWDYLNKHLEKVAKEAAFSAQAFGPANLAHTIGILHDLGKINPAFQEYLKAQVENQPHVKVPHAIWGAALAYYLIYKRLGKKQEWKEICLPIYGHHMGLPAGGALAQDLERFLSEAGPDVLPCLLEASKELSLPAFAIPSQKDPLRREFTIRMIFSAVVDADYLATEEHFDPDKARCRVGGPSVQVLWETFKKKQDEFLLKVKEPTNINQARLNIYDACLQAAEEPPGVFRLTVPTGGGKTRSGLAFALKHACNYDLRRIVVALPYTSIIDQTAIVYREILGENAVLEHHSQIPLAENEDEEAKIVLFRLASENWDATLIVTTTVQLFESLFSNRTSRVRKLHRLTKSVIILDEVQTLPTGLLRPTLSVLRSLVEDYGTTLVLSTATQPAFDDTPFLKEFHGLEIRQIVPNYAEHFLKLQRVNYQRLANPVSWEDLAVELRRQRQIRLFSTLARMPWLCSMP